MFQTINKFTMQHDANIRVEVERIIGFPVPRSCEEVLKVGIESGKSISDIADSIIAALEEEE